MPLDEALSAVSEQTEQKQARRIFLGVRSKVLEGLDLAGALNSFPTHSRNTMWPPPPQEKPQESLIKCC